MRVELGHEIICDGKYPDADGASKDCLAKIHPGTRLFLNKVGIQGHFCEFCHDPQRTAKAAAALGMDQVTFRYNFKTFTAAQKFAADKAAEAAAKAKADADAKAAAEAAASDTPQPTDQTTAAPVKKNGKAKPVTDTWPE